MARGRRRRSRPGDGASATEQAATTGREAELWRMADRTHRELADEDVARIADTHHAWRGEERAADYADVPGSGRAASLEEVRKHGNVLTPGRYVGAALQEDDGEPFEDKMKPLVAQLHEQQAEAARLDAAIAAKLVALGFEGRKP